MNKDTRTPQEILVDIKLGTDFTPDKIIQIKWGFYEGKASLVLLERLEKPENTRTHKTTPLTNSEALEIISQHVF